MASKSKKRRKVLGASCILAALIIAGSSFAWFTSKDEVTNRLTANADYGVSIVESFTPPANWIPGQNVNKDVYAVNTGNIAAFVNEDVKGVLNYTYEKLETAPNTTKGVVLNKEDVAGIEGATTMEAGSVLAWTNTTEPLGNKAVKEDGSGWTPTATGTYIFRRSVNNAASTFTYSGFYYDATTGKYYKIVIGDDVYPNAVAGQFDVSSGTLGAGVTVNDQGIITDGIPNVQYVVEEKKENEQVTFLYEAQTGSYDANVAYSDTNHPARLVVTSAAAATSTDANGNTYNASANAARTEVDYLNKKGVSDAATEKYNQAKMDYDYALALANARNTLVQAAQNTKDVHDAAEGTGGTNADNTAKAQAVKDAAGVILVDSDYKDIIQTGTTNIKYDTLLSSVSTALNTYMTANPTSQVKANYDELKRLYDEVMYTSTTDRDAYKVAQLLRSLNEDNLTPAQVATKVQQLKQELINLKADLGDYKDTFANLATAASTNATGLDVATAIDSAKTAVQGIMDKVDALLAAIDNSSSNMGLTKKSADYTTANANKAAQDAKVSAADTAWKDAVDAYNTAVGSAKSTYEGLAVSPYSNHADSIVPSASGYSANGNTTSDPTITVTTSDPATYPNYSGILTMGSVTAPTDSYVAPTQTKSVATLKTEMDNAVKDTNAANKAYEDAKAKLTGSSDIVIYVNLAEDYTDDWTFDNSTSGTDTASFYLNKILDAGETSNQLIDSVILADTVTAGAYKDMTFDLNVLLDSAQIAYANDQTTILPTAVQSPAFGMNATVAANNSDVTWSKS